MQEWGGPHLGGHPMEASQQHQARSRRGVLQYPHSDMRTPRDGASRRRRRPESRRDAPRGPFKGVDTVIERASRSSFPTEIRGSDRRLEGAGRGARRSEIVPRAYFVRLRVSLSLRRSARREPPASVPLADCPLVLLEGAVPLRSHTASSSTILASNIRSRRHTSFSIEKPIIMSATYSSEGRHEESILTLSVALIIVGRRRAARGAEKPRHKVLVSSTWRGSGGRQRRQVSSTAAITALP